MTGQPQRAEADRIEVRLRFRCLPSDLDGTEVGHLYGDIGRTSGITTGGIGRVVTAHDAAHGYVHWEVGPYPASVPAAPVPQPAGERRFNAVEAPDPQQSCEIAAEIDTPTRSASGEDER